MRIRTVLLVLATVALVLFALINWGEITRPTDLNLGWQTVTVPLGLVLLGLLVLAAVVFLALTASSHTRHLVETRQHAKALQAQRDLAERAEASRFTDLRQQLDTFLRESRQREASHASEFEQTLGRPLRELRNQMQELQRSLSMRLGEMEARLTSRPEHGPLPAAELPRTEPASQRQAFYRGEAVRGAPADAVPAGDVPQSTAPQRVEPAHEGPYGPAR